MSFVKAYGLLAKALLAQGRYADAALALANAPIALQTVEDMVAVRDKVRSRAPRRAGGVGRRGEVRSVG